MMVIFRISYSLLCVYYHYTPSVELVIINVYLTFTLPVPLLCIFVIIQDIAVMASKYISAYVIDVSPHMATTEDMAYVLLYYWLYT